MKFCDKFSYGIISRLKNRKDWAELHFNWPGPYLKRIIIMRIKLVFLIAFTTMLQVSASSFGQKININQTNISLEKALKLIREQSGYDALFDAKLIQKLGNLNLDLKNASVDEALKQCLTGSNFTYSIKENTILIKEKSFVEELKQRITDQFNNNDLKGTVFTKDSGEPLAGATVMIKRTKKTVYTDHNGFFTVRDFLPTDTLVFSYIGFVTQSIAPGKEKFLFVKLEETTNSLDAVMVQGYGKTTQRLSTGNITRVTADAIGKQLISNPIMALQGAVPGLEIRQLNGSDAGIQKVEIRGRKSINSSFSSEPLYVIDGIPLTVLGGASSKLVGNRQSAISSGIDQSGLSGSGISPLYSLNPNDIESIEVLQDADATAIYGSRGGNGVILITTKKGKPGRSVFNVTANQGIKKVADRWEMLNTEQYLDYRRTAFKNDGIKPTVINAPELLKYDQNRYTDWQDYIWGNLGKWTNFDMNLSGGDAQTMFRLSSGIARTTDITQVKGINQRISATSNITHKALNQRLSVEFSAMYSATVNNTRMIGQIADLPPNAPEVYNEKGNLNFDAWQSDMYAFKNLTQPSKTNSNYLNSSFSVDYSLFENLSVKVNMGYNNTFSSSRKISPLSSFNLAKEPLAKAEIRDGNTRVQNLIIEPQINYRTFIAKGKLEALIGGTYQDNSTRVNQQTAKGFASDEQMGSINGATLFLNSEQVRLYKYVGVFGRLNYNWENKYIINFNGRRDGSSRFGPANRFGNFGSVGAAWIATQESWVRNNLPQVIDFVKLRGSYGITGSDNVGDYQYLTQWGNSYLGQVMVPYDGVNPLLPQIQPNDDFHWQRNEKSELGLELAVLRERININFSWYSDYSDNQLTSFLLAGYTGFNSVVLNSPAEVRNTGIALNINARLINTKNFSWNMGFNIGKNKNTLVGYPNIEESPYYVNYKIGESLNNQYVFKFNGVDPQTGQYTFYDFNGDGKITLNSSVPAGTHDDDRGVAINTSPEFGGGMSHNFRFKNLTLNASFNFSKQLGSYNVNSSQNNNMSLYEYNNAWRNPGDNALFMKFTTNANTDLTRSYYSSSDAGVSRADFLRLNALQLSYNLPDKGLKFLGLSNLSVNLTGQNLFVITNFKGLDPEVREFSGMPLSKTITMGLNCSF